MAYAPGIWMDRDFISWSTVNSLKDGNAVRDGPRVPVREESGLKRVDANVIPVIETVRPRNSNRPIDSQSIMWHHAVRLKKVSSWNKVCKGTLRDPRFDQNTLRDSGQHKILTGNGVWRGSSKYGRGMPDFLPVCREKFGKSIANGEIKQEKFIKHLGLHTGTHTLVGSSTDTMHMSKKY